jgi:hypothetical protein
LSDVSLSASAVVAITALLGALGTTIGFLFRAYDGSQKAAITREQELTNKLLPAVEENTRTLQRLVEVFQAQADLPQPTSRTSPRR